MRILFIISSSNFGGTENHLINLMKSLTNAGIIVGVICPNNGIFTEEISNVYFIDIKEKGFLSSLNAIIKVIKTFKPTVIHTHLTRASYIGLFIKILFGASVIATVHNLLGRSKTGDFKSNSWLPKNTDMVFKLLTLFRGKLLAVSDNVKEALIADRVNSKNIQVIWNGTIFADMPIPQRNKVLRNELNIQDNHILVGITCNIKRGKGQILAVEALSLMPKEIRESIKLVMVGNFHQDEYKKSIEDLIEKHDIHKNVIFAGVHTNMREVYADVDIFLHPSYSETCSMAVIEAMATAKPIIVSNIPANSAIIDDNINGILADLNSQAIEKALSKLVSDKQLCANLASNARNKAESHFSLSKMTANYIEFYTANSNQ